MYGSGNGWVDLTSKVVSVASGDSSSATASCAMSSRAILPCAKKALSPLMHMLSSSVDCDLVAQQPRPLQAPCTPRRASFAGAHLEHIALIDNNLCAGVLLCQSRRPHNSKWHPALANDVLAL